MTTTAIRYISAENQAALEERKLVARDFLSFIVRSREDGSPVEDHMWSDVGTTTVGVIDPDTGLVDNRTFVGSGTLVQVSPVALVANLSVQDLRITMSQVHERVNQLVRLYDCQQGRVQLFRGLYDPSSRLLVAPAFARFVGFIDLLNITTPEEGGEGEVEFTIKSHTQEITRSNPDTRSDTSQRIRSSTDDFFVDSSVTGEWEMFWGSKRGKVPTQPKRKKFLGIF